MKTLAEWLDFIVTTLQTSGSCSAVRVVETAKFSDNQFALKVRAETRHGKSLQIRLYVNHAHIDYAYQVNDGNITVDRWDNKEHFPNLSNFPHHWHTSSGRVEGSALTGNLQTDLLYLINSISKP